ncbi:MAG: LVIVD repeat-containing protein [Micromonosporaceae bacterium]
MKRILLVLLAFPLLVVGPAPAAPAAAASDPGGHVPGTARNLALVGHEPLAGRGLNAAPAVYGRYVYVGNRTDGSSRCGVGDPRRDTTGLDSCPHVRPGILVVDTADPAQPAIIGEFGTEFVTGGNAGQTSRELRVWPRQGLLAVMYFRCSAVIHACPPSADVWSIRFFDLAADPVDPPLIATYVPSRKPHEMFLWTDPRDPARALLWLSTPTSSVDPARANLLVTDISRARDGVFTEIAKGNWNQLYPGAENPANYDNDLAVHSMGVTVDGRRTYLAYLRGHFLVLDTSDVAAGRIPPGGLSLNDKLLTAVENRPRWGTSDAGCLDACAESHSAVPVPGRPLALTTDEVYGTFTSPSFGCPWGWARVIQAGQPARPRIISEYRTVPNERSFCGSPGDDPATEQFTSYSSHNPTLTRNLALLTWHSSGLQVIDIADLSAPTQAGWFSPAPLPSVANEDPALSRGPNKVVMWSYPIIQNGLIYVVDIRNGLYILSYTGPHAAELARIRFLEGNSTLGDAARLDRPGGS